MVNGTSFPPEGYKDGGGYRFQEEPVIQRGRRQREHRVDWRRVMAGFFAIALCVVLLLAGMYERQAEAFPAWQPLFKGIEFASTTQTQPAPLAVYAVRVDLRADGVSFLVTPPNGSAPSEATGQTTSAFLARYKCQVAINGSPYSEDEGNQGNYQDVLGLAISRGEQFSSAHGRNGALLITEDNQARIETPPFDAGDAYNAVGGFGLLLKDGNNCGVADELHPRTAVGVSKDGDYLYLLIIDGRQPNYSVGASTEETADWMLRLGAHSALNLDGGGSTALVVDDGKGGAKVLNRPIHAHFPGLERRVANHLGVFAKPLD